MAFYDYQCLDCLEEANKIKGSPLLPDEEWETIFETSHAFEPTKAELKAAKKCPRCGGHNAVRSYRGSNGYFDKAGCHRDMNVHKLETDDPYGEYREKGEVDDLKNKLKRAGQHNPKTKHFAPVAVEDVKKAVKE